MGSRPPAIFSWHFDGTNVFLMSYWLEVSFELFWWAFLSKASYKIIKKAPHFTPSSLLYLPETMYFQQESSHHKKTPSRFPPIISLDFPKQFPNKKHQFPS
jgi:hypothetical protein